MAQGSNWSQGFQLLPNPEHGTEKAVNLLLQAEPGILWIFVSRDGNLERLGELELVRGTSLVLGEHMRYLRNRGPQEQKVQRSSIKGHTTTS